MKKDERARWPHRVNTSLDDSSYAELQRLCKLIGQGADGSGWLERMLLSYAIRHFDDAWNDLGARAAQTLESHRKCQRFLDGFESSHRAARTFVDSFRMGENTEPQT